MLAGMLAAFLVAKRIVRRVERLHLETVEAARNKESLLALENWQKVARALVHELRAPVSPIKLVAGGLISKKKELKTDEYFRFSEQGGSLILEQVEIIEKMIDSFTRFAKLPPPELESQNIVPFLENFVSQNSEYSPELQKLTLEILSQNNAVVLRFDAVLLQRLFFNLLRNAVESNSSPVKVKLLLRVKNDIAEIEIQNSGAAIPVEIVQQLFALKLSLIQPISKKENGLGLGLMICRKIALDHGGDLDLVNNCDGNVTFLLRLPYGQGHIK
jgi:two-component system nitrogen regulation sensor histidine kinase NtrY